MADAKKPDDPFEGITDKLTKAELVERLKRGRALLRRQNTAEKNTLAQIEERLRAKGLGAHADLLQVIGVASEKEWRDVIAFLEEFEKSNLLPPALERLLAGARTLFGLLDGSIA